MNIEELLQSLPSREEIANAVGLQSRGNTASVSTEILPALGILGTGMLIGAGLALLFAPRTGRDTRHDLADKLQEYGGQARDLAGRAGEQVGHLADAAMDKGRSMAGPVPEEQASPEAP